MKRLVIFLSFAALLSFESVKAESETRYYVGGSLGFSTAKVDNSASATSLSIAPDFGMQLNDRWMCGLAFSYGNQSASSAQLDEIEKYLTSSTWYDAKVQNFSVAPYACYRCYHVGPIGCWLEGYVYFGQSSVKDSFTSNEVSVGIQPLLMCDVTDHICLFSAINVLSLAYTHHATDFNVTPYATTTETVSSFGLNANMANFCNTGDLSIGFKYKF